MPSNHQPKQNRVNPFGEIIAVKDRGTLMGNRGCLHNDNREIVTEKALAHPRQETR